METHDFKINKEFFGDKDAAVFECLIKGLSQKAIAEKLYKSVKTIEKNVASIYEKLGVHNAAEAVHRAYLNGIIKTLNLVICIIAGLFFNFDSNYLNMDDVDRDQDARRRPRISRIVRIKDGRGTL